MKLINKIFLSVDGMLLKTRNLIVVIVLTVCMIILIVGRYFGISLNDYRMKIENALAVPVKNVSIMMESPYTDNINSKELIHNLLLIDENCVCFGSVDSYGGVNLEKWIGFDGDLNRKYVGDVKVLFGDYGILQMCKPELVDGGYFTPEEAHEKYGKLIGCYIGSDYKGVIPVGTVYKNLDNDSDIIVLGHFKKGARILSDEVAYRLSEKDNIADILLDDKVMFVSDRYEEWIPTDKYYILSKCNAKDLKRELTQKGKEQGLEFSLVTMEDNLRDMEKKSAELYSLYDKLFLLMMFVSVCMIFGFQIISINENNKKYGILITNGYRTKDIADIIIIENLIKYMLSFSIAFLITYMKMRDKFKMISTGQGMGEIGSIDMKVFDNLFIFRTIPICFLIGLIVVFTAIIVPMMYLRKRPAYEYLRDR